MIEVSYLTAEELSARWKKQVSTKTLANWRVRGTGPSFVKLGGRILYRLEAVMDWERKSEMTKTPARIL